MFESQQKIIVDLNKDVAEDVKKIDGMINGIRKKITIAYEKDKEEKGQDMSSIFKDGLDNLL